MNDQANRWDQLLEIHESARAVVEEKIATDELLETARSLSLDLKLMTMTGAAQDEKVLKSTLQKMVNALVLHCEKRIECNEFIEMQEETLEDIGFVSSILDSIFNNENRLKQRNRIVKTANSLQDKRDAIFNKIDALDDEVEKIISRRQ